MTYVYACLLLERLVYLELMTYVHIAWFLPQMWMCGGSLEICPCSRVGHIYREEFPYSVRGDNGKHVTLKNARRLAEVWLDNYRDFYYTEDNKSEVLARTRITRKLYSW